MRTIVCLIFCSLLPLFKGSPCGSLEGMWYNQLGSELNVQADTGGRLIGEYRTAVERYNGSAGETYTIVIGAKSPDSSVFGFSVVFREGNSTASWLGQCSVCDGNETLKTTWILQVSIGTCSSRWSSTLMGQDYFTRYEQKPGPRRNTGIDVPQRISKLDGTLLPPNIPKFWRRNDGNIHPCGLEGNWYDQDGAILTFNNQSNGYLSGTYTPIRSQENAPVYGFSVGTDVLSTFGFQVERTRTPHITVWTAQCQKCDDKDLLETSWLKSTSLYACDQMEYGANIGKTTFSRTPPVDVTPDGYSYSWLYRQAKKLYNFFS